MSVVTSASANSAWRGYNYYLNKKVIKISKLNENEYEGIVRGNDNNYNIYLNIKKPRKSKCDCPFAKDRSVVCKHIVALYFTLFPEQAKAYIKDIEDAEKKEEERQRESERKIKDYINSLSKEELQEILFEIARNDPNCLYYGFYEEDYCDEEYY